MMYPSRNVAGRSQTEDRHRSGATRASETSKGVHPDSPPRLKRIDQIALRDRIVNAIRDAIVQGKLKPGEKIPEIELATQLGVSRTPIREAIRILEQQGLVQTRPKNGTYIAQVDREDARDGLLVRTVLEQLAVKRAIERMEKHEWAELCGRLELVLEGMGEAISHNDPVAAVELDIEFHTMLIHASGNRYLSETWRLVGLPSLIWSPERETYPQSQEDWIEGYTGRHRELLDVLRGGDPEACAVAIASHISRKLTDIELHQISPNAIGSSAPDGTGA